MHTTHTLFSIPPNMLVVIVFVQSVKMQRKFQLQQLRIWREYHREVENSATLYVCYGVSTFATPPPPRQNGSVTIQFINGK